MTASSNTNYPNACVTSRVIELVRRLGGTASMDAAGMGDVGIPSNTWTDFHPARPACPACKTDAEPEEAFAEIPGLPDVLLQVVGAPGEQCTFAVADEDVRRSEALLRAKHGCTCDSGDPTPAMRRFMCVLHLEELPVVREFGCTFVTKDQPADRLDGHPDGPRDLDGAAARDVRIVLDHPQLHRADALSPG